MFPLRQVNDTPDAQYSSMSDRFISTDYHTDCFTAGSWQTSIFMLCLTGPTSPVKTATQPGFSCPSWRTWTKPGFLQTPGAGRSGLLRCRLRAGTVVLTGFTT